MNTNEQAPECCPFCGAGLGIKPGGKPSKGELGDWARFTCGTHWFIGDAESERRESQEPRCADAERERLTRERDEARAERDAEKERADGNLDAFQKMLTMKDAVLAGLGFCLKEKDDLLARVQRLEEAGDRMTTWLRRNAREGSKELSALRQWNAAKEAKP